MNSLPDHSPSLSEARWKDRTRLSLWVILKEFVAIDPLARAVLAMFAVVLIQEFLLLGQHSDLRSDDFWLYTVTALIPAYIVAFFTNPQTPLRVEQLLDLPSAFAQHPVAVVFYGRGIEIGRDEGVLTFVWGYLNFEGSKTRFSFDGRVGRTKLSPDSILSQILVRSISVEWIRDGERYGVSILPYQSSDKRKGAVKKCRLALAEWSRESRTHQEGVRSGLNVTPPRVPSAVMRSVIRLAPRIWPLMGLVSALILFIKCLESPLGLGGFLKTPWIGAQFLGFWLLIICPVGWVRAMRRKAKFEQMSETWEAPFEAKETVKSSPGEDLVKSESDVRKVQGVV